MTERLTTLDEAIVVGERLSPSDRLRLIGILSERLPSELEQGIEPIDLLSLAGLGAGIWKDLDITTYVVPHPGSADRPSLLCHRWPSPGIGGPAARSFTHRGPSPQGGCRWARCPLDLPQSQERKVQA